jgi:protein-tyrosine phosphatase
VKVIFIGYGDFGRRMNEDIDEIIEGKVYMSDVFTAENLEVLDEKKITHIVTVSKGIRPRYPEKFQYFVIEVNDETTEDLRKHFRPAIDFIDNALFSSGVVLIHCAAGISRSGAITCAYLMFKNNWSFKDAFDYGRTKRSKMFPNLSFQKQLQAFESELRQ